MTDNISRMYELAKATKYRAVSIYNSIIGYGDYETIEEASNYGDGFDIEKFSPPFTPEKQLELIKWLSIQRNGFLVLNPTDNKKEFIVGTNYYWGRCETQTKNLLDFPQALAGLVRELWKELTEVQREEIKEILK